MPELNQLTIKGKKVFYSLSFDIDDFIGDGIWWLQIYDENRNLIYDKPFLNSISQIDILMVRKIIKEKYLIAEGIIL